MSYFNFWKLIELLLAHFIHYLSIYLHSYERNSLTQFQHRGFQPAGLDPRKRSQDKSEGSDMINANGENPKRISSTFFLFYRSSG